MNGKYVASGWKIEAVKIGVYQGTTMMSLEVFADSLFCVLGSRILVPPNVCDRLEKRNISICSIHVLASCMYARVIFQQRISIVSRLKSSKPPDDGLWTFFETIPS